MNRVHSAIRTAGEIPEEMVGAATQVRIGADRTLALLPSKGGTGPLRWQVMSRAGAGEAIHGNSLLSPRTAYLYRLTDESGNFLKWGVTQDMATRYPKSFMEGLRIVKYAEGSRAEMIALERNLVETMPGPLNNESWAGIVWGGQP